VSSRALAATIVAFSKDSLMTMMMMMELIVHRHFGVSISFWVRRHPVCLGILDHRIFRSLAVHGGELTEKLLKFAAASLARVTPTTTRS
jgi:hypothetical protein